MIPRTVRMAFAWAFLLLLACPVAARAESADSNEACAMTGPQGGLQVT